MAWRSIIAIATLVLAVLSACKTKPVPTRTSVLGWPALPSTPAQLAALVARATRRPLPPTDGGSTTEETPQSVLAAAGRAGWSNLPAGEKGIARWLQSWLDRAIMEGRSAYILVGSCHDSAGQAEAFRRWFGPASLRGLTHVALEPLTADGRWQGLALAEQKGHGVLVERFAKTGEIEALAALSSALEAHAYTAWKYGYVATLRDLFVDARALGVRALGCDMPIQLQRRTGSDDPLRLRELHCVQALHTAARGQPVRVTMLWGEEHVRPAGLRRFLPQAAQVLSVHLLGARNSRTAPDSRLAETLTLNDPVLVPLGELDAALLIPDRFTGGEVERSRSREPRGEGSAASLVVSSDVTASLSLGERRLDVGPREQRLELVPGDYTYALRLASGHTTVGALRLSAGGETHLELADGGRVTRIDY